MKKLLGLVGALVLTLALTTTSSASSTPYPSVARADTGTPPPTPLTATPASVNFGTVLFRDPDCPGSAIPIPGCPKAVLTVTNPTAETVSVGSKTACANFNGSDTCATGLGWGGLTTGPYDTCHGDIPPGGSCLVTIIGRPDRTGLIDGYFVMRSPTPSEYVLIVPVEIFGTVNCFGSFATIVGTRDDDAGLAGTTEPDVIAALKGNDVISADADDAVCGGEGMDQISGAGRAKAGLGDDSLMDGSGDQVLFGNLGNDDIAVGAGSDRARGGPGDDSISVIDVAGSTDPDFVDGGEGFDTCTVDPSDRYRNCEVVRVSTRGVRLITATG